MDKRSGWMTVRLTSRWPYNPISLIVGLASGSHQFSHAIAIIDDVAYEASMTHGCRSRPVNSIMKGIVAYRDMDLWVPDLDGATAFAKAQMGKRYDWLGAVGIPFTYSEDWSDDASWWCSDLVFAILLAGGVRLYDPAMVKRIRPIDLQMVDFPKGALRIA